MSGSGDAFIYETISNTIFDGGGTPVTLNGTFEVEFNPGGTIDGVSNISLVATSSDPATNPSTFTSGYINNAGVPAPYPGSGDTVNEIYVTASFGSFTQAYLDFNGEQPTTLIDAASYGHYSSIGFNNGTNKGLESIDAASGGSIGTITSTPLPLSPVTTDKYVLTNYNNVVFDQNNVAVTLSGTMLTEFDPNGTLIGVSQVSLAASGPGSPSQLVDASISKVGTPGASGNAADNEIFVTIASNGGGSFQHVALDFIGETPGTLVTDPAQPNYSSIGYSSGTEALPGGPASNPGTNTDAVQNTSLLATISNVIFAGSANNGSLAATLSGTFQEEFNPGGTLVGVSNINLINVSNGNTVAITQTYDPSNAPNGFTAGDPNAGGYAAINQINFQSGAADSYRHIDYIDLLGEEPNAVFAGGTGNSNSSDSGTGYQPINGYNGFGSSGIITYTQITPCFAAGTHIATPHGETLVQNLNAGDEVTLADGATAAIIWAGHRKLNLTRHPAPEKVRPIRIQAGALGPKRPARDLIVSPDHALFIDGVLIPAKSLLNGINITQEQNRKTVTYYHIELARHAVMLAENTPAESYLETGNRNAFENAGPALTLHPDFAQTMRETKSCAPFAESGAVVEAVRTRILTLAGVETTQEAAVTIKFAHGEAIIKSRFAIPGDITADPRDRRTLGVKIASLSIADKLIPLDHPALNLGWYDPEPDGRWTNGAAVIPAELLAGSADVKLTLSGVLPYRVQRQGAVRT